MSETKSIAKTVAAMVDGVLRIYSLFDMGKSLIEIYKDKHNTLKNLFIKAFDQAIYDVSEQYTNDSIQSFLENCRKIDNVYCCKDLYDYLCKKNNDREGSLSNNVIVDISNKIAEQLNCIVLNDNEYKDLYNVFSYYQLNSISFKLNELDDIMQEFIKLIDDHNELRCDNELFARAYKERLFMHAVGDINISLSDIFVMPDVKTKYNIEENALETIRDFVNNKDQYVFFLEGFGGYGKSSIVSYLAYNYLFNRSSPNIDFLDNRQLVIIRLRDIDSNDVFNSIKHKLNNLEKLSNNAVLIFDGLDELCLIENKRDGINISETIIHNFINDDRKIIITSRPTYIKYEKLRLAKKIKYLQAEIMSFKKDKRQQFIDLFTVKDNTNELAAEYLKMPIYDKESIYGSPFILYLIMSGGIEEDERDNSWKLLHRIFHEEMFKPMYHPSVRNLSEDEINKIYQYNCDIAYEMFKTQNQRSSFTYDELSELLPEYNSEEYVKKSHGLFSYMRYNNGAVEFVHNHVRDFFLCEKVLRTMSEWYKKDYSNEQIALELGDLLKYYHFEEQTKVFVKEALENDYNCITDKCTPEHLPSIFDLFHDAGGMVSYNYFNEAKKQSDVSFNKLSSHTINNASCIYVNIYLNKKVTYINWFSKSVTSSNIISMMSLNLYKANLEYANLCNVDLSNADLSEANLRYSYLQNANMSKANLKNADLSNADLSEANLREANLDNSKFCRSYLNYASLYMAQLSRTDLREADLSGANLNGLNIALVTSDSILYCTKYNSRTKFPTDFKPQPPYWFNVDDKR